LLETPEGLVKVKRPEWHLIKVEEADGKVRRLKTAVVIATSDNNRTPVLGAWNPRSRGYL